MRHDEGDRKTEAEETVGNDIWRSPDTLRVREDSRGFEVSETDTSLRSGFETMREHVSTSCAPDPCREISFARVTVLYFDDIDTTSTKCHLQVTGRWTVSNISEGRGP